MDEGDLARNQPCGQNIVALSEFIQFTPNLAALGVTPPRTLDPVASDDPHYAWEVVVRLKKKTVN